MSDLSNPTAASPGPFAPGLPAMEAPVLADASVSLTALLSGEAQPAALQSLKGPLSLARLGSAAGLFRVLRLKHPTTANHCVRVALGCSSFASHLKLDRTTREQIELAALLHDIGKLSLPDQILNKPARLNEVELAVMERHLQLAVHIIEPFCNDTTILDTIRYAGNWFDGSRPSNARVRGLELPVGARILAIQNAYDAMTTDNVYREALTAEYAMDELKQNAGRQFDPELVSEFLELQAKPNVSHQNKLMRRWVELSSEQADSLWTLATPISQVTSDAQSIFQQRLLESMHDGVIFFDQAGKVVVWNQGAVELTGLSKESVHHKEWHPQIADMRDMEGNTTKLRSCPVRCCLKETKETTQRMTVTNRSTCERIAVNVHMMPVNDAVGRCHGAIMVLHDVTSEYSLEACVQNLHTKATVDALTGVHNRAEFDRRHRELVELHSRSEQPMSLVICDIDRFKMINDTFGHQAGDIALVSFARLIESLSRDIDTVARYGGEEFVLICPGCDLETAALKAEKIRRSLAGVRQPALKHTVMTASFGVTQFQQGDTPDLMLKRADAALYRAKELGRNRVVQDTTEPPETTASTWKSWLGLNTPKKQMNKLVQSKLRSSVPAELVMEKIRGFVDDNRAEVVSNVEDRKLELSLDEWAAGQRRQTDRPMSLSLRIEMRDDEDMGFGTLIDVAILYQGHRERRMDDVSERAEFLMTRFRSYLMAEDV